MQLKKIVLFIFTFAFSISYSQSKSELTAALEKLYQQSDFPGFTVAIVNENGIVYQNAFGYADIQNKKPYTIASVQNIGSISKTFIGIALMKAIELGYFDLDTAVNDILPFQVINPNAQNETIQIRHLATHTWNIRR